MSDKRITVIGGGAAGLAAAITAARGGAKVTILEHKDRVGKKILSTGNGRCNYTNAIMGPECFYAAQKETVRSLLDRYPTERILKFFREIGVEPMEREGYYYPASGQAAAVLDCLRAECDRLGVEIRCNTEVLEIRPLSVKKVLASKADASSPGGFQIKIREDERTMNRKTDRVILCCGGQASPVTGSDGSGYDLAHSLGHRICRPFPSLTGLKADPKRFKPLAGIRAKVRAALTVGGHMVRGEEGELQLTENGLSGIVIFQLSHPAIEAYLQKKEPQIHIHFLPQMEDRDIFDFLKQRRDLLAHKMLSEWGVGLFHKKLWGQLVKEAGVSLEMPASQLDDPMLVRLQRVITDFTVPVTGYLDFDRAQVTAGGVDLTQVSADTFESVVVPGLYFAGEILDVDGICGGYNLHFAWASGMAAAEAACSR